MLKPGHYKIHPHIIDKLSSLLLLLGVEKDKYDQLAAVLHDRQLRDTIHALAQENNQYEIEVRSHLNIMGIVRNQAENESLHIPEFELKPIFLQGAAGSKTFADNIVRVCCESEKKMISTYRDVLNEPYLAQETRRIMRYQLNGMMYAFLRLKLLNSTHFARKY
ncbi:MAG: hypothetical protein QM802_18130 [Agriterribacter sp.]